MDYIKSYLFAGKWYSWGKKTNRSNEFVIGEGSKLSYFRICSDWCMSFSDVHCACPQHWDDFCAREYNHFHTTNVLYPFVLWMFWQFVNTDNFLYLLHSEKNLSNICINKYQTLFCLVISPERFNRGKAKLQNKHQVWRTADSVGWDDTIALHLHTKSTGV